MKTENSEKILIGTIILHHIYILFSDTTAMHGLPIPSVELWTFILLVPLTLLTYFELMSPATSGNIKVLYLAAILALASTIMRIFNFTTYFVTYSLMLIIIAILSIKGLSQQYQETVKAYIGAMIFGILILIVNSFQLPFAQILIPKLFGPFFELLILISIIYFNLYNKPSHRQKSIIILITGLGFIIGYLVTNLDVPSLILKTVIDQTLGIGQVSFDIGFIGFTLKITTEYLFILHFVEIFNVGTLLILKRRSLPTMSIILTGMKLAYPPLSGLRALAILQFLRSQEVDNVACSKIKLLSNLP